MSGEERAPAEAMDNPSIDRRAALRRMGTAALGAVATPIVLSGCRGEAVPEDTEVVADASPGEERSPASDEDVRRFREWIGTLRAEGLASADVPLGLAAVRVGELAVGTPYEAYTLEQYIHAGGSPMRAEPLTLSLTRFDCVSLVESCLAIARVARRSESEPAWSAFEREMERMRYRDGRREGYSSRLHYFAEWMTDNERRGLLRVLGRELGGIEDSRPLRFMSTHPDSYPAMAYPEVREEIAAAERALDGTPRWVVPTSRIPTIVDSLESGDVLAFATSIEGLDVTHAAFAYRDPTGVMRVLHAPLSGGVVEVTRSTVPQYVAAIRQATGILVARPLPGPAE